ncbi:hypothetical protein BV898_04348 [Hypsibius exemplaris]|uniref:Uncharacterized protein n=1 Tax=Hypsibius exemplaris TaxID=2072580 RepID=A0A1W0X3B1_HYPEX|nr:hypothetical protein BV898_04348 [Hypsibius exemplaris]
MKKKKDEKNVKVLEKASVITSNSSSKKPAAPPKKGEKDTLVTSPLKDHLSDATHPTEPSVQSDALKTEELSIVKPGDPLADGKTGAPAGLPGSAPTTAAGSIVKVLLKAIPKPEAYTVFTTKIPNGMEPFRLTESQRQMVAVKEKTLVTLAASVNCWIDELCVEQGSLGKLSADRARTRPQTSAELPVLSFDEYKSTSNIKHLRYLIETGCQDIQTCQADLAGLRENLASSRKNLLINFEEWYARTYEQDTACETAVKLSVQPTDGASLAAAPQDPVTPLPSRNAQTAFPPNSSAPFTSVTPLGKSEVFAQLEGASKVNEKGVRVEPVSRRSSPAKIAPKDAAELHKMELEQFVDRNPEAASFYRVRDKVRQIIKVREENETYHRFHPQNPLRKLDPELAVKYLIADLPSALNSPPAAPAARMSQSP